MFPLDSLDSYLGGQAFFESAKQFGIADERFLGVYINDSDNLIFIKPDGLNWSINDQVITIPFNTITGVSYPEPEDARELRIALQDGSVLLLPVLNDTGDTPDWQPFLDFLETAIYWPHHSYNPEDISGINNRRDLSSFLDQQDGQYEYLSNLVHALRFGFPEPWQLRKFQIDPDLANNPGVWRILALVLCTSTDDSFGRSYGAPDSSHEDAGEEEVYREEEWFSREILDVLSAASVEVLDNAKKEAERIGYHFVGAESLLFALVQFDAELCCRILNRKELTTLSVRYAIKSIMGHGPGFGKCSMVTIGAIKIMNKALELRNESGSEFLEPEHILLAMNKFSDGTMSLHERILEEFERF